MAITTYFALQMITAVEVAEREKRNEITFATPNGLSAKNRSYSDCVSQSLREMVGEGEGETEEEKPT